MGVTIKMVTGDPLVIAAESPTKVGLGTNILDAAFWAMRKRVNHGR